MSSRKYRIIKVIPSGTCVSLELLSISECQFSNPRTEHEALINSSRSGNCLFMIVSIARDIHISRSIIRLGYEAVIRGRFCLRSWDVMATKNTSSFIIITTILSMRLSRAILKFDPIAMHILQERMQPLICWETTCRILEVAVLPAAHLPSFRVPKRGAQPDAKQFSWIPLKIFRTVSSLPTPTKILISWLRYGRRSGIRLWRRWLLYIFHWAKWAGAISSPATPACLDIYLRVSMGNNHSARLWICSPGSFA